MSRRLDNTVSNSILVDSTSAYTPYSTTLPFPIKIMGNTDSGQYLRVPVTAEGHLEIDIHGPRLPFGAVHTEKLTPVFQHDAVYGIDTDKINTTTGHSTGGVSSATNMGTDNLYTCSTGTTALSFATIQSKSRLRYRPGQGVVVRYTALFSVPVDQSILVAGCGTAESGLFFGYNNLSFGILHSTGGKREARTLTVTTASSSTNSYQVTLNGLSTDVSATNTSGSTLLTAYQISLGTYPGWKAETRGSTVVFLKDSVGTAGSTYSLAQSGAGTPAAGTFSQTISGLATTDTWYYQDDWNGDKMDGTGFSGITLNPQNGNVYEIDIQYLGFGAIVFKIETAVNGSTPSFNVVHTLNFPNTRQVVTLSQPSFPFTMSAYSAGSITNVSVSSASFAGFVEGDAVLRSGPRYTYNRETSGYIGSVANTYYPLFTIHSSYLHGHVGIVERPNQCVSNIYVMSCSHDDTTPIGFFLIRNANLEGIPNFIRFASSSITYWDRAATTCTITDNNDLIYSLQVGQTSGNTVVFETPIQLQPGETITFAARAATGTATYVNASLNAREDQ